MQKYNNNKKEQKWIMLQFGKGGLQKNSLSGIPIFAWGVGGFDWRKYVGFFLSFALFQRYVLKKKEKKMVVQGGAFFRIFFLAQHDLSSDIQHFIWSFSYLREANAVASNVKISRFPAWISCTSNVFHRISHFSIYSPNHAERVRHIYWAEAGVEGGF